MTAIAPSRSARFRSARALRLEIKHSPVLWVLPLFAVLFYYDTYRTMLGLPPIWSVRASVIDDHMLFDCTVFAAGIAAWAGSREGRRKTGDLLATTARSAWARQATVFAATTFWLLLAFLAGVAVLYGQTASQATWGGPPLWPVVVGVVGVAAACAIGFTGGTLFPGRFIAPLVAVAVLVLNYVGNGGPENADGISSTHALLATGGPFPAVDAGVFYHVPPDVSIAKVMFTGGLLIVMLGLLALWPSLSKPAGWRPRTMTAAAVACGVATVACGVAAAVTAFVLVGTAQYTATTGWVIPALHDAASDQPVPYTPQCTGAAFRVCIHPAFSGYLAGVTAALQPAAAEIAGLPGAPVRAEQTVSTVLTVAAGTTSVYEYPQTGGTTSFWGGPAVADTNWWRQALQQDFLTWFVSSSPQLNGSSNVTAAQQVVVAALTVKAGLGTPQFNQAYANNRPTGPSPAQMRAAARRFESLSPGARHAWLAAHIAEIRAGGVTLAQIP